MENKQQEQYTPQWATGGRGIEEAGFCRDFLVQHLMSCQDGIFYSQDGRMQDIAVKGLIYDMLRPYARSSVASKVISIFDLMKLETAKVPMKVAESHVHCANGTLNVGKMEFTHQKELCFARLPVAYNPEAPRPVCWEAFLNDLLEPGDQLTLQEFLGYLLLPVNYAQKMMIIIGNGGEGKSRIGIILRHLLGEGMCNGSIAKVEASPFARADLQNRLVMVDDDLQLSALSSTSYLKSIVTAEQPMDLERKGVQSYQGMLYCRFLAFGNGNLRALHDRSHGFFRRQIILTAKPRPSDRVDDPYLSTRLKGELEGILQWCICGLERLFANDFQFTLTEQTQQNMACAVLEGNNIPMFLKSEGYIRFDPQGQISSRRLYRIYQDWCEGNMLTAMNPKTFSSWLIQQTDSYGLSYSFNIPDGNERRVRGFKGIRPCNR